MTTDANGINMVTVHVDRAAARTAMLALENAADALHMQIAEVREDTQNKTGDTWARWRQRGVSDVQIAAWFEARIARKEARLDRIERMIDALRSEVE